MQFILSEEEYRKLIHKDRIKQPIDEFTEAVGKSMRHFGAGVFGASPAMRHFEDEFRASFQTLKIKLDL
jgi:hypothetical protein